MFESIFDIANKHRISGFRFWFHPFKHFISESPDAYLSWNEQSISLKDLNQKKYEYGEGYLTIDSASPPFVYDQILWIPAIYFSSENASLDLKTPLKNTLEKISSISSIEIEQPFYLIDCELYQGDLVAIGRRAYNFTEYVTADETRVSLFLSAVNQIALEIGIDVEIKKMSALHFIATTRNKNCSLAIDQNIQIMEIIKNEARKKKIAALFSEKPFQHLPSIEKVIRLSFDVSQEVIQHAICEHANFINAALSGFNLDPRIGKITPSIRQIGEEIFIRGVSPSTHPAFAVCAILAAIGDSLQLQKIGEPTSSHSASSFLDPRTIRAFTFMLSENELFALQEMCFAKYVTNIRGGISAMLKQFNEKVLPLLMTQELSKRSVIEQKIAEIEEIEEQIKDFGYEIQRKALSELGIPKILNAQLSVEQFMNAFRI
ncbi:MAG TPA: glutamine synthetase III [Chlamydiales bacterium]|nr:glutamine synthetase III [Chlamydiales bacterium]